MSAHRSIVLNGRRVNTGRTSSPYSNLYRHTSVCRLKDDRFSCFKARGKAYEQQWEGLVTFHSLVWEKREFPRRFPRLETLEAARSEPTIKKKLARVLGHNSSPVSYVFRRRRRTDSDKYLSAQSSVPFCGDSEERRWGIRRNPIRNRNPVERRFH